MKRPERIDASTKTTTGDYLAAGAFWGILIGYPLFVAMWRWLSN